MRFRASPDRLSNAHVSNHVEPNVASKKDPSSSPRLLPADAADVALIAAETCAAIGAVSVSWWHDQVRAGKAPKAAIQQPRFTRWSLAAVRGFWADCVVHAAADNEAGERMSARAKKASAEARKPAAVAKARATRAARIAARAGTAA